MLRRLADWLDSRSGYRAILSGALAGPIPGGARFERTFGTVAVVLFVVEALTGLGLAAYYAPTTTDAWASVHYIQTQVALGWLLRGLHHQAGNALIVFVALHLLQALVYGAYRSPRELTWVSGVVLVQLLIVASHTGYLLPADLRAYWATEVLVGIAGNQPVVGPAAQLLIQGGPRAGNVTLTHLYALHVLVAPLGFTVLLAAHLWLRRRTGAIAPLRMTELDARASAVPYFPYQLSKDLLVACAVLAGLMGLVVVERGVPLAAPADPAIEYVARPEWYMLPIFQLRHFFTGELEFVATTVLPGVAVVALAALPFLYGPLSRLTRSAHSLIVGAVFSGLIFAVALGGFTEAQDRLDPKTQGILARAEAVAREAQRLAAIGVPVTGPLELYRNDVLVHGQHVFEEKCATCHEPCDRKPYEGQLCLEGYASRTWLRKFLRDPSNRYFFGNTGIDQMDAFTGEDAALEALVEFLYAQGDRELHDAALAAEGAQVYSDEGCESCHTLDGKGNGEAPDLKGYASAAWLRDFIRTPDAPRFYGQLNKMDSFPHEALAPDALEAVIAYLRAQTDADAKYP